MTKINKKILIVEDDKDILFIFKTKFVSEGFLVVDAADGEEGVSVAEKEKPDLILSDILMPRMDGVEMAKQIKKANSKALIIFLTNVKDINYAEDIRKASGIDYLIKSELKINEVVDRVKIKLGIKIA